MENIINRSPEQKQEIIETVEITNNFDCIMLDQHNDKCKSIFSLECRGVLCQHYNRCSWCKTKECDNCKNAKNK